MANEEMLTDVGARMLAEAFPIEHRPAASKAAEIVAVGLAPRQWTERFSVSMMGQTVSIPARLHFTSGKLPVSEDDDTWPFVRALQTRSNDGYERQRAARDLLADLHPWGASFIVALLGEYIVEILDDVSEALTPEIEQILAAFIIDNRAFWATTKRRVTSYWNAYYRSRYASELRRAYRRDEYVGFHLTNRLEAAAFDASIALCGSRPCR
jgi:hypothetical protein